MKTWNLKSGDPGSFSIAADVRFGKTDYLNDHIWECKLVGGEPPTLAVQTTFGLRARSLKLFPRFVEGDSAIVDPGNFSTPPGVQRFHPNYLSVKFSPLIGIDVICEYWVPSSNILTGRIQVTNSRLSHRIIHVQWGALLSPASGGHRMTPMEIDSSAILKGHTDGIFPIITMSGNPVISPGPYPALSVKLDLAPGANRSLTWAHAAAESETASWELAQQTLERPWDAEIAAIDVQNDRLLSIETGEPDWDAAFTLAQKTAIGLLVGPTEHLPNPSFVLSRQPDKGYSSLGDGLDYGFLWSGQPSLEADYLNTFLLPGATDLAKGLLFNFLEIQTHGGVIDNKPGLAGQRSHLMATPILANFAWRIYETTQDATFLGQIFPKLLRFIQAWFSDSQDRDGDGLPEWSRPSHSGFEDHPLFSRWDPWSLGGDISKAESPSLCAFLYNEINILIKMAYILEQTSPIAPLEALAENLKTAVNTSWDVADNIYHYWDRESHCNTKGEHLGDLEGPDEIHLNRKFKQPIRFVIRITSNEEINQNITIFIHGIGTAGNPKIERINSDQIRWNLNQGNVSSERIYTFIEYVKITGVGPKDQTCFSVMDLSGIDQTLLSPLWAQIPEKEQAATLIENTIKNSDLFWKTYGIAACRLETGTDNNPGTAIHMIWNKMIGEGLIKYGYREDAAELVTRLMSGVIGNLMTHKSFFNYYHTDSGLGIGEPNALGGLAPLSLFLDTLGVRIISSKKVSLTGKNPFPWPVTLRYRGLTINRNTQRTKITFPGGQTAIVKSEEPRIVTLEKNNE